MAAERHVKLFRNGPNQAVRIPREFELPGDEGVMRKEGDRLVIEPVAVFHFSMSSLHCLPSRRISARSTTRRRNRSSYELSLFARYECGIRPGSQSWRNDCDTHRRSWGAASLYEHRRPLANCGSELLGAARCASPASSKMSCGRSKSCRLRHQAMRAYGGLRADLERRGLLIGANDMLIAAHALASSCTLVTATEREFSRVPGLKVETWLRPIPN